jgi:hypothetical protein
MFQIHGGGLSRGAIEAVPTTRLYEAYSEKQWGAKLVSLKLGQLAADSEFFNTKYTDGAFPDQRFASNGVSLAAPSSSGTPLGATLQVRRGALLR